MLSINYKLPITSMMKQKFITFASGYSNRYSLLAITDNAREYKCDVNYQLKLLVKM